MANDRKRFTQEPTAQIKSIVDTGAKTWDDSAYWPAHRDAAIERVNEWVLE